MNNQPWQYKYSFAIFYLHISLSQIGAILGISKSFNRTIAVYFPFFYRCKYSNPRLTIYASLTFIIAFFALNIPILFQEDNRHFYFDIEFNDIRNTAELKFFWNFYHYTDYVAVALSFIFDVATAPQLWRFFANKNNAGGKWTKEKIVAEALLLLQNFSNVVLFGLQLIPTLSFGGFCGTTWRRNCFDTTFKQMLVILYYYNSRRAIWRTLDEVISFFIQYRIWRNTVKK